VAQSIVLTLIGPDRPGLVEAVSDIVVRHGGNWLESRMAQLGGQFAGILRIEIPAHEAQSLGESLSELKSYGLQIVVVPADSTNQGPLLRPLQLHLMGQDRPGIVREIAQVLAARHVNVEELQTQCQSAPMSAEQLFVAIARLGIPDNLDVRGLRADLELIASDLMVDITLEPPEE
jgi:glycine cleavage system regulatory protein